MLSRLTEESRSAIIVAAVLLLAASAAHGVDVRSNGGPGRPIPGSDAIDVGELLLDGDDPASGTGDDSPYSDSTGVVVYPYQILQCTLC